MYRTDTIAASAADWLRDGLVSKALDADLRADLATEDRQNGRIYGLRDVYIMLYEGTWPRTGAERDELCRRSGVNARTLYQWRRDVLLVVAYAVVHAQLLQVVTNAVTNADPEKP